MEILDDELEIIYGAYELLIRAANIGRWVVVGVGGWFITHLERADSLANSLKKYQKHFPEVGSSP